MYQSRQTRSPGWLAIGCQEHLAAYFPDKLLYHLVRIAGRVLPHGTLLAKVWGREYVDEVDYVRVYIRRLRDKLGDDRSGRATSRRSAAWATPC